MRKIKDIVIHCSATREGKDFRASDIAKWHKEQGYKDIGYHYVVGLDGIVEKGRDESEAGAHVAGHNSNSIGICYIGGIDKEGKPKDTRTEKQKDSLIGLLMELLCKYPDADILGHRDYKDVKKDCPCFDVRKEYDPLILNPCRTK